ncbi:MAG TPA: hypothetical protein VF595_15545 [Tepidisphaeraceae bacterium]
MTATLATRQPAALRPVEAAALPTERTTWVQRLGAGVTRSFSRIGLMQRVALRVSTPRVSLATGHTTRPASVDLPDPLRTCLPPPTA